MKYFIRLTIFSFLCIGCASREFRALPSIGDNKKPNESVQLSVITKTDGNEAIDDCSLLLNGWRVMEGSLDGKNNFSVKIPDKPLNIALKIDSVYRAPLYSVSSYVKKNTYAIKPGKNMTITFVSRGTQISWGATIFTWIPGIIIAAPLWLGMVQLERDIDLQADIAISNEQFPEGGLQNIKSKYPNTDTNTTKDELSNPVPNLISGKDAKSTLETNKDSPQKVNMEKGESKSESKLISDKEENKKSLKTKEAKEVEAKPESKNNSINENAFLDEEKPAKKTKPVKGKGKKK